MRIWIACVFMILFGIVDVSTQTQVNAVRFQLTTGPCMIRSGSGSPEGVITGNICDTWINTANGQIYTKWTGTSNTGWKVGFQDTALTQTMQTANYASQTTGYQLTAAGALDARYGYFDEFRAKLFSAEEQAVYRGSFMVAPSHSEVSQTFTCPAAAATSTLWVKDAATLGDARVFASGNWVVIRNFSRTDGDNDGLHDLTITDCVGQVTSYADGTGANTGQQSWTFTRGSGGCTGAMTSSTTVAVGNAVLDFGTAGRGVVEISALDGAEGIYSPYTQTKNWTTCPVAANFTVGTRLGNLDGILGAGSGHVGLYAGTTGGTGATARFMLGTNLGLFLFGGDIRMYDSSSNQVISLEPTTPSFALGNPLPTAYGTGTGIWMGQSAANVYSFRVGVPGGPGMFWDGAAQSLTVRGNGGSSTNMLRNTDCPAGTDGWTLGSTTGLGETLLYGLDPWDLNDEGGTCYFQPIGTPANTTQTFATTHAIPVVEGSYYEFSAYLGVHSSATDAVAYISWRNAAGGEISNTFSVANDCEGSGRTGGRWIGIADSGAGTGYCRSGSIGLAPAGAVTALGVVLRAYNGSGSNPATFFVHAFFGEATATQTQLSAWGPPGVTQITGGLIQTQTITADKILVTDLFALNATIGGWVITSTGLTASSGSVGLSSAVTGGDDIRIFVGHSTPSSAPFRVTEAGVLTAASGTVGGWTLGSTTLTGDDMQLASTGDLTAGTGNNVVRISDTGTYRFWIGHATASSAPFRIEADGDAILAGGDVTINSSGVTINSGSGTNNRYKISDGSFFGREGGGTLSITSSDTMISFITSGGYVTVTNNEIQAVNMTLGDLSTGSNRTVCVNNLGRFYTVASGAAC